ncbi:hypothetical protein [Aromatoleum evansii]|uniref:Lipoprotein n=1 Tax=Aromatoleum evansii TaxID=59406 RepID=A0ABZ1AGL5_AROEV|nr:hypothetical protein [Aromatoleum evansii]NMG32146.1 hypothetical protein [Aromatoleum evansii]WRL45016.1 hypothetical protein U5817_17595 [Aromatoleum evansii]
MPVRVALCLILPVFTGCALLQDHGTKVAAGVGAALTASELDLFEPEFIGGALIAYAIYDPLAPTWDISVTRLDEERVRFDLRMKRLATGGEGEAHQVFVRNAREIAESKGFAGYDVMRFEEGIDSTRPFAHRVASGEVRYRRSRTFPGI